MPLTAQELTDMIRAIGQTLEGNKAFLTELDSAIGDADHGINMAKGFRAVEEKVAGVAGKDAGTILKTVGMTLVSTVGGAAGPLYGTAFMRAGTAVAGRDSLTAADLVRALGAAVEGVKQRGKAGRGDKTMVDALEPAYEAIQKEVAAGKGATAALAAGVAAAAAGVEYTKGIIARKGRASYLGERSIGHQDPGATSSYLILKTMAEFLAGRK